MKAAVIVLSDPKQGTDEALGRLFNALATVWEYQNTGEEVTLLFQGAGTRWIGELLNPEHPGHELFKAVESSIAGVSCGCADVFGATDAVEKSGYDLIKTNAVPGTTGLPSLRQLKADGYDILVF